MKRDTILYGDHSAERRGRDSGTSSVDELIGDAWRGSQQRGAESVCITRWSSVAVTSKSWRTAPNLSVASTANVRWHGASLRRAGPDGIN